ncbi:MAG TPA: alpha/beta fold hydrolase [Gaiella sp.]|jgi:pimeloyl-ACP methyl ester carboxylesterase|nr:alpha/beta fold hydrolase [Gaiella sp.]
MTVRIAWERHGAGPPLILVQGIGLARWGWGRAADLLAVRFDVLVYDNRGIGESDAPPGPYSIPMLAEDALQVLDEAGASSAHVLGASLGGMVAQQLAVEHPERVERLVLCCTTPGRSDAFPVPEPTVRLLAEAAGLDRETAIKKFTRNALSARASDELVERIVRLRLDKPQEVAAWGAQVAAGAGFEGIDLGRIETPTLVLHGSEDNAVDVRNAALLAERIPNARSRVLEGGHMFWWEVPEEFARVVGDFLS